MGDALTRLTDTHVQLEESVQRDEQPRGHRDRNRQHDQAALRIGHAESEQDAEDTARCADDRRGRKVRNPHDDQVHQRSTHDAREVVEEITTRPEQAFNVRTEHEQREHIEENMNDAAMHEAVRQQLPHLERRSVVGPRLGRP